MRGCRGFFSIGSQAKVDDKGHYPDTYLSIGGGKWSKGVAFINGFNLVNYPAQYVPAPGLSHLSLAWDGDGANAMHN